MTLEQFDKLGVNPKNELFWDGRPLEVRRTFVLSFWQKVVAFLAILGTLATVFTGFNNASVFLCARDIRWLSCPSPPPHL